MYGPFEVTPSGNSRQYCTAKLPDSWKIHHTFNISLLEQYPATDPKKLVVRTEAEDAGWKLESIIASAPSDNDPKKHVYLVK
jgi:hypothetical protein